MLTEIGILIGGVWIGLFIGWILTRPELKKEEFKPTIEVVTPICSFPVDYFDKKKAEKDNKRTRILELEKDEKGNVIKVIVKLNDHLIDKLKQNHTFGCGLVYIDGVSLIMRYNKDWEPSGLGTLQDYNPNKKKKKVKKK